MGSGTEPTRARRDFNRRIGAASRLHGAGRRHKQDGQKTVVAGRRRIAASVRVVGHDQRFPFEPFLMVGEVPFRKVDRLTIGLQFRQNTRHVAGRTLPPHCSSIIHARLPGDDMCRRGHEAHQRREHPESGLEVGRFSDKADPGGADQGAGVAGRSDRSIASARA